MGYDRRGRDADGLDADGYSVDGHYWEDGSYNPDHDFSDWTEDNWIAEFGA